MLQTTSTVIGKTHVDRDTSFCFIAPIDLTTIFRGYGPLPAVVGTTDQTGAWDAAGQSRTILLSDGSQAREELTNYSRPQHFSYIVSGFTGTLRLITLRARGEWHFEEQSGGTSVRWSYAFEARSVFTFPLLVAVVRPLWQAYMRKALREALAQLEARNTGPHHNVA
jgi:Polyketide cyclase / dehydrase and lipid transport